MYTHKKTNLTLHTTSLGKIGKQGGKEEKGNWRTQDKTIKQYPNFTPITHTKTSHMYKTNSYIPQMTLISRRKDTMATIGRKRRLGHGMGLHSYTHTPLAGHFSHSHLLSLCDEALIQLYDVVAYEPDHVGEVRGSRLIADVLQTSLVIN